MAGLFFDLVGLPVVGLIGFPVVCPVGLKGVDLGGLPVGCPVGLPVVGLGGLPVFGPEDFMYLIGFAGLTGSTSPVGALFAAVEAGAASEPLKEAFKYLRMRISFSVSSRQWPRCTFFLVRPA